MNTLEQVKRWIGEITEIGLLLVALGIVAGILFGETVPFFTRIVSNLTGLLNMLGEMREDIKPPKSNPAILLGEFINSHMNNALVVNGEMDARSNMEAMPLWEPRGELLIRYEPDNKHLYVAAKQFKDFCVKQQVNYKTMLKELQDANVFVEGMNKRMSKGMKVVSPAVRVLKFDASSNEFIQMDGMIPSDENRDSQLQH